MAEKALRRIVRNALYAGVIRFPQGLLHLAAEPSLMLPHSFSPTGDFLLHQPPHELRRGYALRFRSLDERGFKFVAEAKGKRVFSHDWLRRGLRLCQWDRADGPLSSRMTAAFLAVKVFQRPVPQQPVEKTSHVLYSGDSGDGMRVLPIGEAATG